MCFSHASFKSNSSSRQVSGREVRKYLSNILSFHNLFRFSSYISTFRILFSFILFSLLALFTHYRITSSTLLGYLASSHTSHTHT